MALLAGDWVGRLVLSNDDGPKHHNLPLPARLKPPSRRYKTFFLPGRLLVDRKRRVL